ncbi:ThuA domain-containing protein [Tuwongella immobilis]|uniref:ThuA-like domain-containing protein n=1 Tax=Tuwongella immobilis TaxID=692036 RepID=A0A6C2YT35_9BACT|nr:ThuA domain-containing protein [Tuwongella immobilis]VIP04199.1 Uncharacterized protein OS=Ignisphaera aggregans (strain DSM 17230 / JCM 13409 / AQ1.S1) GN=Igag_1869 PE=4 SV=1: ThuA [Tuwongella immobilis]VTS05762.1 Uncharacterized protein OS=Ignisphaera aggregans (strain DSM 17230 / JCM 13409 / AQ1.S1) GN=Igag_1869 PE=4 SV=1: ThuA [Tuwongella immobilis]
MIRSLSRMLVVGLVLLTGISAGTVRAAEPKKLLLVTHSAGFVHDSVALSEEILKEIAPKYGFTVTCFRFTSDPDEKRTITETVDGKKVQKTITALEAYSQAFRRSTGQTVTREQCGRVNAETLKQFDAVLFFTTGNPLTKQELVDLTEWVKAGGAFAGTHCATDTLYGTSYGELIGAYFENHPWHQKIKLRVEDAAHAAAKGFREGDEITDEIYQFRATPYSRDKLRIILSVDNSSIDVTKGKRPDQDYAIAWVQSVGKGKVFYTSLGHRKDVWKDARFQQHLFGGLNWTVSNAPGSSEPSGKKAAAK